MAKPDTAGFLDGFFPTAVISRIKFIGGGWVGVGGGWEAEGGLYHPQGDTQQQCVLSRAQKQPQSTCMVGQDRRWQQFDTTCSLISAPQWLHRPCSGP